MPSFEAVQQYARLVFAGVLVFVIAYQSWMARLRPGEPLLAQVAGWAAAALTMVAGRTIQHASTDPATILFGVRVFHTGLFALVPLAIAIVHETRGVPHNRLSRFLIGGTLLPVALTWVGHLVISDRLQEFDTMAGPLLGPVPAPLGWLAVPYLAAVTGYLVNVARHGRPSRHWSHRASLRVMLYLFVPALVNDSLLYAGLIHTFELISAALFVHIMVINAGILSHAGSLFTDMERTVDVRTAELRAHERQLSAMLESRRQILDAVPDGICLLEEGRFAYANGSCARILGVAADDLVGRAFADFAAPDQERTVLRVLASAKAAHAPTAAVAVELRGRDGRTTAVELSGLSLGAGQGARTLMTIRDVSERKQLLNRLQIADRLAAVGTLAAGVAHEINNPLTFINANLAMIRDAFRDDPVTALADDGPDGVRRMLDDCVAGTQRIGRIVRDLHQFARADDTLVQVDCATALEQARKIASVAIRHRAEVVTAYGATPPVLAEPRRLGQVFLNLLVNASQAIPDDGAYHEIRITTRTRPSDGWAVVEIADTGRGVDPELLPTVFDPFVTTKPVGEGTGLGLFICQGIVAELGGTIRLLPGQPRGTIAEVALPAAPAVAALAGDDASAGAGPRLRGLRILVVDDEPLVRDALARMLRAHDVTCAAGGREAMRALDTGAYDVVLCDLVMPESSGAVVWRHAATAGYGSRFILMTGGAATSMHQEFMTGERVPVLHKPFTLAEVEREIEVRLAGAGPVSTRPPDVSAAG